MVIKNFLRRFLGGELVEEENVVINNVPIGSLNSKIKLDLEEMEKKKEIAKKEMVENRERFTFELENQIILLKNINLDKRKEIEKIKQITLENLKVYISHLEKLIEDLAKNHDLDAEIYTNYIYDAVAKFKHFSHNCFEKATILIGRELEQTRITIREFLNTQEKIFKSHKSIFEKEEHLQQLQNLLIDYESFKTTILENERESMHLSEKMQNILQEKINNEQKLNVLINSSSYRTVLEEKKRKQEELNILNSEIMKLKQSIDLKALARVFHNDAKKMEIISAYKDNFLSALINDENIIISKLIELAKPEFKIKDILEDIKKRHQSLEFVETSLAEKEEFSIKEEIQKLSVDAINFENETKNYRKKQERFEEKLENIELELKNYAKKIFWNVEFDK